MNLDEGLLRGADVLVVDDEPANVALVESILERNGFTRIRSTTDPRQFRALFVDQRPDIVLLDLHMPHVGGLELLREVGDLLEPDEYLPVLVLSADVTAKARRDALGAGATDFLTKPFDTTEVGLRVLNHLETRRIHLRLDGQRRELDELIRRADGRARGVPSRVPEAAARRVTRRDRRSHRAGGNDGRRCSSRSAGVTDELADLIGQAAPLHDLGKVGRPRRRPAQAGKAQPRGIRPRPHAHHDRGPDHRGDDLRGARAWPGSSPRPTTSAGTARATPAG